MSQDFAYQDSPSSLGVYIAIPRPSDYPLIDFTTITSVVVHVTLPGETTLATWAFSIVTQETTATLLVVFHAFQAGDTTRRGSVLFVVTPMVGSTALPPAIARMPICAPSLG